MRFINSGNINRRNVNKFKTSHSVSVSGLVYLYRISFTMCLFFMTIRPLFYTRQKGERKKWWNYNYFSYFTSERIIMLLILQRKKNSNICTTDWSLLKTTTRYKEKKKNLWINTSRLQIIRSNAARTSLDGGKKFMYWNIKLTNRN